MPVNAGSLTLSRRILTGSLIGGLPETQEMLDFCAEHHIGAEIEIISADKINEAWERVLASDVRYRFVIDTGTLRDGKRRALRMNSPQGAAVRFPYATSK